MPSLPKTKSRQPRWITITDAESAQRAANRGARIGLLLAALIGLASLALWIRAVAPHSEIAMMLANLPFPPGIGEGLNHLPLPVPIAACLFLLVLSWRVSTGRDIISAVLLTVITLGAGLAIHFTLGWFGLLLAFVVLSHLWDGLRGNWAGRGYAQLRGRNLARDQLAAKRPSSSQLPTKPRGAATTQSPVTVIRRVTPNTLAQRRTEPTIQR